MSTPRMLIADDNPLSLRFLSEALALLGIDHATAADGSHALAAAQREPFDLLLLDALMPELNGADVLQRVRAHVGPSQQAIALATTAGNDPDTRASLLAAGFTEVLLKPLAIDALRSALARHVPIPASPPARKPLTPAALDDALALAVAGGDATIVSALRSLLLDELDALPAELQTFDARQDSVGLTDRLHRLDASAGFCGAPALQHAAAALRTALKEPSWPTAALADFLVSCAQVRQLLAN